MIRKSPYIDENYSTLMSSDLNLVLTNTNNSNISFEENSLNFSNMTMKKAIEEEKSGNFNNIIEEKTPEKNENPSVRKKKQDDNQLTAFNKTLNIMVQGSSKFLEETNIDSNSKVIITKCSICGLKAQKPPQLLANEQFMRCLLCKRTACCLCFLNCSECLRSVCKICTVINYDQSFDRLLCLECNK